MRCTRPEARAALGLAEFVMGLLSIADRDLLVPRSDDVVLARALRELAPYQGAPSLLGCPGLEECVQR